MSGAAGDNGGQGSDEDVDGGAPGDESSRLDGGVGGEEGAEGLAGAAEPLEPILCDWRLEKHEYPLRSPECQKHSIRQHLPSFFLPPEGASALPLFVEPLNKISPLKFDTPL